VVAVGVEDNGEMEVPYDVDTVGWYRHGPLPGASGSAVLAAHVDLAGKGPGVFFDLTTLTPGDVMVVDFNDGSQAGFEVLARRTYDRSSLPLDTIFADEGPPFLTLVTCGGAFDRSTRHYESNVVVYAVPVPLPGEPVDKRA
jgi:sortase (surface protein transpeptidase)